MGFITGEPESGVGDTYPASNSNRVLKQESDMKAKISASLAAMLLALGLAVGCSKSASNSSDAQIIGEVATKVQGDATVQTKAVAIQSNNGIVTLSGQVASDA